MGRSARRQAMTRLVVLGTAWSGGGLSVVSAVAAPPEGFVERARHAVAERVGDQSIPGMSAAIVFADGSTVQIAEGQARVAPNEEEMGHDSKMLSGSIGKVYCAVVVLQMVGDGTIGLDALASEYAGDEPWFGGMPNAESLTIRSLLNHTSGIPEHVWSPKFGGALKADPQRDWSFGELLEISDGQEALFEVGEGWSYADTNFLVLGAIVEKLTGERYEEVLKARVLEPLGLSDTLTNDQAELPGLVSGYTQLAGMFPISEETAADGVYGMNPSFERTGGGITSTALDLALFGHAVFAGEIVPEGLRDDMLESVPAPRLGLGCEYGLGIIKWRRAHGVSVGHSGIMPGYLSEVRHYPGVGGGVTIAVQVNTDRGATGRVLAGLVEELAGLLND